MFRFCLGAQADAAIKAMDGNTLLERLEPGVWGQVVRVFTRTPPKKEVMGSGVWAGVSGVLNRCNFGYGLKP